MNSEIQTQEQLKQLELFKEFQLGAVHLSRVLPS
jgi:hypothetical protein